MLLLLYHLCFRLTWACFYFQRAELSADSRLLSASHPAVTNMKNKETHREQDPVEQDVLLST